MIIFEAISRYTSIDAVCLSDYSMTSFIRFQDFCLMADRLHESIVVQSMSGRFVYLNSHFQQTSGYSLDDLHGVTPVQLVHPDDRHVALDAYQKLAQGSGQAGSLTYRFRAKTGEYLSVENTMTVLPDEQGKPAYIVCTPYLVNHTNQAFEQARQLVALEERQRLARDLHDAVSQTLFSASVIAETLPILYDTSPDEVMKGLNKLSALTKGALAEMRTLLVELRPGALTEIELTQLLTYLVNSFRTRLEGDIVYETAGCAKGLDPETKVSMYRIAQEALNNVVRHSRATYVSVELKCTPQTVELDIRDNGNGFDARGISASHMGLRIMYERAESSGIDLDIISFPGEGTQVHMQKNGADISHER